MSKIFISLSVKLISINYFPFCTGYKTFFKQIIKFNFSNLVLFVGIIKNGGVKPNIIPSYSELIYYFRAPSMKELQVLTKKAEDSFRAAALATGCTVSFPQLIMTSYLWAVAVCVAALKPTLVLFLLRWFLFVPVVVLGICLRALSSLVRSWICKMSWLNFLFEIFWWKFNI